MDESGTDVLVRKLARDLFLYDKPTITGSQLGDLIGKKFPELNLRAVTQVIRGPGALSKFVETRLSDILQVTGKVGADLVFSIKREVVTQGISAEQAEILALRRFVIDAVSRMTFEDLRHIPIPAGLALEVAKSTLKA